MKLNNKIKQTAILLLTISVTAGCASQQKQDTVETATESGPLASSVAIKNAKTAMDKASSLGYIWRDTGKILKKAEAAAQKGDEAKSVKLANKARSQAEMAEKQYYLEQGIDRSLPSSDIDSVSAMSSYHVIRGDSLWGIAGKDTIYGNPYQWPLIYKANSDKIKDADLIYPGQEFDIDSNPSDAEVSSSINHAKTRGVWSIGDIEESDKAYMSK